MMKMKILIHELIHMFEKQVSMLSGFYLNKFIVKVLANISHFNLLLLLDHLFDLSVEHSSRPSFSGNSTIGYDGSRRKGTNDGSDTGNDGGDIVDRQQSPFTNEDDFTHAT